jgi:hypothetical protein
MRSWRYYDALTQGFYTNRALSEAWGYPVGPIGYVTTFLLDPGYENTFKDMNWTIVPQPVQTGVIVLPAPNASERVLTAGMIQGGTLFNNGLFAPTNYSIVEPGGPFGGIITGVMGPVNHPNGKPWISAGENLGMLDGSAKWRKFKDMRQRKFEYLTTGGTTAIVQYWW